jgi:hypothetical protein
LLGFSAAPLFLRGLILAYREVAKERGRRKTKKQVGCSQFYKQATATRFGPKAWLCAAGASPRVSRGLRARLRLGAIGSKNVPRQMRHPSH